jgi:uncharacterized membrane protein
MAALSLKGHDMTTHSPPQAASLAANGTPLSSAALAAAVLTMGLLAGDPAHIGDLAAVRRHFDEARWSAWNLVRTLTTTAAFGCLIAAAMMYPAAR